MACNSNPVDDSFRLDMFMDLINFNFTLPNPSLSSEENMWYAAPVALLMLASLLYSISTKKKNIATEINVEAAFDDDEISWESASEVFQDEMMLEDAKYAEELQVLKALLASNINMEKMQAVCKICLEKHESWQMFSNSTCSHSFCYDCTTKHATAKIQAKNQTITCPGINCNSTLDLDTLRLIIPRETLIKWDEFLCESVIPESHKLYCPFTECSVLLINDDTSNSITKIDCPVCRRSFCAACRVPWHSEFSCKGFGKLKGIKEHEKMTVALAKKKKWRKCPNCNFFVEKVEGCVHITCRCKYEFCYVCGAKWSHSHYGCTRARS